MGVVILSFMAVISGVQMLLSSIWAFAVSSNADKPGVVDALSRISPEIANAAAGLFFVVGLVLLVLAISSLLLAKGYYRGEERARRRGRAISAFAIIWAVLGILLIPARADPGSPWWTILINIIIIVYLGRDSVKGFFRL
jgi:Na+-translocating ferredoxin:NAD+ oxidoreductase RnfD subunit